MKTQYLSCYSKINNAMRPYKRSHEIVACTTAVNRPVNSGTVPESTDRAWFKLPGQIFLYDLL